MKSAGWIALNPMDSTFGPRRDTAVWLTDGERIVLATRTTPESEHCIFQMVLGFPYLYATHFAYAGPTLPEPKGEA